MNIIKIKKNFGSGEVAFKEWKDKPQSRKQYLQITHLIRDLYPEYRKNSENSTLRKQTHLKNGQKIWTDI